MGAKVFVCTDGNDNTCQECGTFNDPVANGEWVAMPCGDGNGILGRFVKVLSAAHALQITEIEIISNGTEVALFKHRNLFCHNFSALFFENYGFKVEILSCFEQLLNMSTNSVELKKRDADA